MRSRFRPFLAKRGCAGFSLLEVTIAIALLSIAIAMIIQLYSMNLKSTRKAELYTEATILARSAMDELLSSGTLEETSTTETIADRFEITRSVAALEKGDKDRAQPYEVTVLLQWQGGSLELKARKSIPESQDR